MTEGEYRSEIAAVLDEAQRKLDGVEWASLIDWLSEWVEAELGDSDLDTDPWSDPDAEGE